MQLSDRELIRAFVAAPSAERFQPLLDRYLAMIHSAAARQVPDAAGSAEVTRAVFLTLARHLRRFAGKALLAGWLFEVTRLAVLQLEKARKQDGAGPARGGRIGSAGSTSEDAWARMEPALDQTLSRLSRTRRNLILTFFVLNWSVEDAAEALRLKPGPAERRAAGALGKLARRLRPRQTPEAVRLALVENACAVPVPPGLREQLLTDVPAHWQTRPEPGLVRQTLRGLAWVRWRRRLRWAGAGVGMCVVVLAAAVTGVLVLWNTGQLVPMLIEWGARQQAKSVPELAEPARPWPGPDSPGLAASGVHSAAAFYLTTNVWVMHLRFSAEQWAALTPRRVPPVPRLMQRDGTIVLRNPNAQRNGLAGSLGFDFEWTHADLELGGRTFADVACRYRGNGTYMNSLFGLKRPLKVDLDKYVTGQDLAGVRTLNFANLVIDSSCMSDALAYELFREAGVPAPRTAYAWLRLSAAGQFDDKPLGLYLLIEAIDGEFAADRFGSKEGAIFKPVTYDLFQDLGPDWAAYEPIYDPKTKLSQAHQQRVIDFARLLTHASDAEFAERVGDFLDLDEFARFLSGLVLLSSYDGFLSTGQNFYVYLDPRSDKFGFIPWDLDHAWGGFPFIGTPDDRENASIWRPWVSRNRLLERLMPVERFREIYQKRLGEILEAVFVPERLARRIDEVAAVIRGPVAAESSYRLRRFDQSVSTNWIERPQLAQDGPTGPVRQLKRFIVNRAQSVRDQLEGRSQGVKLADIQPR